MKCLKMVANKYGWSRVTREYKNHQNNTYFPRPVGLGLSVGTESLISSPKRSWEWSGDRSTWVNTRCWPSISQHQQQRPAPDFQISPCGKINKCYVTRETDCRGFPRHVGVFTLHHRDRTASSSSCCSLVKSPVKAKGHDDPSVWGRSQRSILPRKRNSC